jgi:hypothetical protein
METVVFESDEARKRWRDVMDAALVGKEVVIKRYNKPQTVVINYETWTTWKKQRIAFLDAQSAEGEAGNYLTHEQVMDDLRQRGLID